jgi:NADPH-dependent 7-cyano-7-deazaguanine reductase QueF
MFFKTAAASLNIRQAPRKACLGLAVLKLYVFISTFI